MDQWSWCEWGSDLTGRRVKQRKLTGDRMSSKLKIVLAGGAGLLLLAFSFYSATHSVDVEQLRVVGAEILRGDDHLYPAGVYEGREVHPRGFSYAPALAFLFAPLSLVPAFRGLFIHLLTANPVIGQGALRVDLTASEEMRVNLLWLVFSAAVLALLIAVATRPAPDIERRMLTYSMVTTVILLVAPHTQRIYFCSLFFPCIVLAAILLRPEPTPDRRLIQLTLLTAFCVSSVLPAVLPGRRAAFTYERLWPHAFLTLALLGVTLVVWRAWVKCYGLPARTAGSVSGFRSP
jgi:hypothetical protein